MAKNPEVHLTTGVKSIETAESYLQIQGVFSGPDDPNYCVCRITPYRIEYHKMGPVPAEVWEI